MKLLKKTTRKITDLIIDFIESINRMGENVKYHKTAVIKGCKLFGEINISEGVSLYKTEISGKVEIGRYSTLWGPNIFIFSSIYPIKIGNFCSIAKNLTIQEYSHNYSKLTSFFIGKNVLKEKISDEIVSKGSVIIGNDVWIGTGVTILSGVKIGNGAVIGSNTVVTKNIPAYSIVGGNPAKILKYRFEDAKIKKIQELKWWDWSVEKIIENKKLFL